MVKFDDLAQEKYPCGCAVYLGEKGETRAVSVCEAHESVFSENKSLKQLTMDIHDTYMKEKHAPKPVEKTVEPPK